MMKVNLGLEEELPNKSYSIDYNEDYTSKYYGKNIRGERYYKTMANLIGKSLTEAQSYAQSNNLELIINESYDPNNGNNIVLEQSIHVNALLKNYNSLTITVNNLDKIEYNE